MGKNTRWVFANILGYGDVVFETESRIDAVTPIRIRKLTTLHVNVDQQTGQVTGKRVAPAPYYELTFARDPIQITPSAIALSCDAPKELADAARQVWSGIQIAKRLPPEDNGRSGPRRIV